MDTRGLSDSDLALIDAARAVLDRQYVRRWNTVGAAIRAASDTYSAIHLDADVGRIAVCAEAIALGMAIAKGDRVIEAIVAVTPDGDDGPFCLRAGCAARCLAITRRELTSSCLLLMGGW